MRALAVWVATACASCGSAAPATSTAPAAPVHIDKPAVESWLRVELGTHTRAAVAGVVVGDSLVWHVGIGSRDGRTEVPPDRTSVFRIGSITKVLTAIAVVQLRDRGVLDLDAPVTTWVPELTPWLTPAAASPGGQPLGPAVTLRHLVTHTSGIPSMGDGTAPYWEQTPPSEAQLLKALHGPLRFVPGTDTEYSNAGMALAGVVVSRASKQTYRAYMAQHVLKPLGIQPRWDRSDVADAVRVAGESVVRDLDPPTWQLGAFESAGGLWASLDDMVGLARFAHGGAVADRVLAPASRSQMFTDDPLPGPHGIAWSVDGGLIAHTGSTGDYSASFVSFPQRRLAVIVLASGRPYGLVDCVAMSLARALADDAPPASCAALVPKPTASIERKALIVSFDRLIEFFAHPSEGAARATFAPAFLGAIPPMMLLDVTKQVEGQVGKCTSYELPADVATAGRVRLRCAKADLMLEYRVETAPPHRFEGAQLLPVP
ncbi:MAG: serine hydrolase domain-containing protein [Kofleriaceae bacterium]